jgi:small subunit ribosomal protein S8
MVSTDPISDMLTRVRNAIAVRKPTVDVPYSRVKQDVAQILKSKGFIEKTETNGEGIEKKLVIQINQGDKNPSITEIVRISRPGRRVYSSAKDIPVVKRGRGIVIISTSKGVMAGDEAKKNQVGGELLCKVY